MVSNNVEGIVDQGNAIKLETCKESLTWHPIYLELNQLFEKFPGY